jgi:8-oxo-dGTP pyrophosphatase MutT (NUDIX family)
VHPRQQVGALCWRLKDKSAQVLLITSRDTGRWIVPKGWIMDGRTEAQSALTEAWEEAGVIGAVSEAAMGQFVYPKVLADGVVLPVRVALFPVEVARLKRRYPEIGQRERRWFRPAAAAERLGEADLARIVATFVPPRNGDHASR